MLTRAFACLIGLAVLVSGCDPFHTGFEDFEDAVQAGVMVVSRIPRHEEQDAVEQILQTQQSPDAFVERIFVDDH